jgi:hypothetical protein
MKSKIDLKSLVIGTLLGIAVIFCAGAAAERRSDWEYKVITGYVLGGRPAGDERTLEKQINSNLAEGWQFVSASGVGEISGFAVLRKEKE